MTWCRRRGTIQAAPPAEATAYCRGSRWVITVSRGPPANALFDWSLVRRCPREGLPLRRDYLLHVAQIHRALTTLALALAADELVAWPAVIVVAAA